MKSKIVFWSLVVCVISPPLCAQQNQKLDSLLNSYKSQKEDTLKVKTAFAVYDFYYSHNPKLALQYSLEGLEIAKKIHYKRGIARSFNHKGHHLMIARKIDSARKYFEKSLKIYDSLGDNHQMGLVTYNLIQLAYVTPDYEKALNSISENMEKFSYPDADSIVLMKLLNIQAKVFMRQTAYKKLWHSEKTKN